jgi:hypothetical protein
VSSAVLSLEQLWSQLRRVQSLRFEALSQSATGWTGDGTGTVIVSEPSPDVLVFTETGSWQSPGRTALRFTNVFRWSAINDVLRLEHLRFGPSQPVFLFDMVSGDQGEWREVSPHLCQEDCYAASLKVQEQKILVAWTVQGPQKQESIRYTYW